MRGLVTSRPLFVAGLAFWSRARPGFTESGLPTDPARAPVDGDVTAFWFARSAPAAAGRRGCFGGLVQGGGLPAERGELARDRHRNRPRRLAALSGEVRPAPVQALLAAPGDLNDTGVLA
jgi:hypothetical protein